MATQSEATLESKQVPQRECGGHSSYTRGGNTECYHKFQAISCSNNQQRFAHILTSMNITAKSEPAHLVSYPPTSEATAHLARLPAPTERGLIPQVLDVKAVDHFVLAELLLAVDARPGLPGLGDEVEQGGEDEVEEDGQEDEEGEEGEPLLPPKVHEPPEGLRDGKRL